MLPPRKCAFLRGITHRFRGTRWKLPAEKVHPVEKKKGLFPQHSVTIWAAAEPRDLLCGGEHYQLRSSRLKKVIYFSLWWAQIVKNFGSCEKTERQ